MRATSERTIRAQAQAIYAKAGVNGRAALSAFFLEDLLAPMSGERRDVRSNDERRRYELQALPGRTSWFHDTPVDWRPHADDRCRISIGRRSTRRTAPERATPAERARGHAGVPGHGGIGPADADHAGSVEAVLLLDGRPRPAPAASNRGLLPGCADDSVLRRRRMASVTRHSIRGFLGVPVGARGHRVYRVPLHRVARLLRFHAVDSSRGTRCRHQWQPWPRGAPRVRHLRRAALSVRAGRGGVGVPSCLRSRPDGQDALSPLGGCGTTGALHRGGRSSRPLRARLGGSRAARGGWNVGGVAVFALSTVLLWNAPKAVDA